ncbi:MAG: prepilin-type N-terminal cleavage/methylation domain-containing protein [Elusimicrobiota bacterium]
MPLKNARGYTLSEMMMVVAIVGILATVAPTMLLSMQNFFMMTSARYEIQRDARTTLDTVNRYMRQAVASTVIIDTPSGQGPFSRIRFRHVDGRYMEFRQSGSKLFQIINAAESVVSTNLVYIAFTYPHTDDTSIISVSITMGKSIQLGRRKVLELTIQKIRIMN